MRFASRRLFGREAGAGSRVSERLLLLVQFEPLSGVRTGRSLDDALLVADGVFELARFGVSGGQGVEKSKYFPAGPLAGRGRILDRPLAVTDLGVGARGQNPGKVVVRGSKSGLRLNDAKVSLFCRAELLPAL